MSNVALLGPAVLAVAVASRVLAKSSAASRPRAASAVRPAGPPAVQLGHTFADPDVGLLRAAVTREDWDGLAAVLQPCRDRGDHSRLTWLISCLDELPGDFLLKIGDQRPEDPLARTLAGARQVTWAWDARTGARASQVSREQFDLFHERLRGAEAQLYAAVELDPETAAPWTFLVTSSRGLQHGVDVTRRRFEAGVRRAPDHLGLHAAMLQQICAKWSGSHEEMHAFARESLAKAPAGSNLGALTAHAHMEHWLDLPREERTAYIRDPAVAQELRDAAAVSVLHPAYAPTESPFPALNAFAVAFWLAGDHDSARQMFERIGDHPTRYPWGYCGNAGQVFATARQECTQAQTGKRGTAKRAK